ncbi:hypothetical protein QBC46DRAFT_255539 [Diplogelasinospora grovesii]|uniref:Uncharacterized protein n=1 Tax=Diplogelasinospora grovesii TaxID=303347 RepID=A0AAN6S7F9_9PEZI|nr:hypothetical protein QBC46DRAFT_255539 [Diplogelasinospora grovesii]
MFARQEPAPRPPPVRAEAAETQSPEDTLGPVHLKALKTAIMNVLGTELAEFTYAQIVDGYPTNSSFREFHYCEEDHPVRQQEALCDGAVSVFQSFRSSFNPLTLKFNQATLKAFEQEHPGTRPFHLRLIELLAVAVHQIAANLFDAYSVGNPHKVEYDAWRAERLRRAASGDEAYRYCRISPPVVFYHRDYPINYYEQYPRDISDVVGYWAEAKIFGGVLLFDRGESETECREVWVHPSSQIRCPRTLFPPTAEQFSSLVAFLLSEQTAKEGTAEQTTGTECPLPIRASSLNGPRFLRYHATKYFHIFRDKYDSRLPEWYAEFNCSSSSLDFPEIEDELALLRGEDDDGPLDETKRAARIAGLRNITPSSPLWCRSSSTRGRYP